MEGLSGEVWTFLVMDVIVAYILLLKGLSPDNNCSGSHISNHHHGTGRIVFDWSKKSQTTLCAKIYV